MTFERLILMLEIVSDRCKAQMPDETVATGTGKTPLSKNNDRRIDDRSMIDAIGANYSG